MEFLVELERALEQALERRAGAYREQRELTAAPAGATGAAARLVLAERAERAERSVERARAELMERRLSA